MSRLIVGLLLICSTLAWWEVGHMLVSQIAQDQLLQVDPSSYNYFNQLILAMKNFTDGRTNTFVQAAVWPDDVKEHGVHIFDDYHFLDRIYDPEGIMPIMSSYNRDINALNTIGWCLSVLKKNKFDISFERAFMARYLLHIVGDIHQPLHAISMFNSSKTLSKGDLGGNLINITLVNNDIYNLHAFMDSIAAVIQKKNETTVPRPLDVVGKVYIENLAKTIIQQYPISHFGDKVSDSNVNHWTLESYNAAIDKLYSFVANSNKATTEWTNDVYELCKERIALAGYRLANTISSIYK